jgi:hypothetical protein
MSQLKIPNGIQDGGGSTAVPEEPDECFVMKHLSGDEMQRTLITEGDLLALVQAALAANPDSTGCVPSGLHEHEHDERGCNWDISYLTYGPECVEVKSKAANAASRIVNDLRTRYNLQ